MNVIAHVAGASGSGKTTLVNRINRQTRKVLAVDLDYFDDKAVMQLGWSSVPKNQFTDEMLKALAERRQSLMDDFLLRQAKPVLLAGFHTEGIHVLDLHTDIKFILDTDAETSAKRAMVRSWSETKPLGGIRTHRTKEELPQDIADAQRDIDFLLKSGYLLRSEQQVWEWVRDRSSKL